MSLVPPTPNALFHVGLALRLRRIRSNDDTYKQRSQELKDYLIKRGYDLNFLKTQIKRASDISRNDAVPFVITYNPVLPNIARTIHKHSNILYASAKTFLLISL